MMKCSCDPATFLNNENMKRQHWNINNVNKYKYKKTKRYYILLRVSLRIRSSREASAWDWTGPRFMSTCWTRTGTDFWSCLMCSRELGVGSRLGRTDLNHNISFQINLNRITSSHVLKFIHSQNTIYVKNSKSFWRQTFWLWSQETESKTYYNSWTLRFRIQLLMSLSL